MLSSFVSWSAYRICRWLNLLFCVLLLEHSLNEMYIYIYNGSWIAVGIAESVSTALSLCHWFVPLHALHITINIAFFANCSCYIDYAKLSADAFALLLCDAVVTH